MAGKSKSVSYKRTISTSLKAAGILNINDDGTMFLCTEDGDKALTTLFSDFQGAVIQLSMGIKQIEDLPDPSER